MEGHGGLVLPAAALFEEFGEGAALGWAANLRALVSTDHAALTGACAA